MGEAQSALLVAIRANISKPEFADLLKEVGMTGRAQHHEVYSVTIKAMLCLSPAGNNNKMQQHSAVSSLECKNKQLPHHTCTCLQVEKVLDDEASVSKAQFFNKVQQCFAVRQGADNFLDLARSTFSR